MENGNMQVFHTVENLTVSVLRTVAHTSRVD